MAGSNKGFNSFPYIIEILKKSLLLLSIYAILMSGVRLYLLNVNYVSTFELSDIVSAIILGFRLDISILGFVLTPIVLLLVAISFINSIRFISIFYSLIKYYLIFLLSLISLILFTDLAYFSYFFDHINIMIFGIFDDDTKALFEIAKQNYNLPLVVSLIILFLLILTIVINKIIIFKELEIKQYTLSFKVVFLIITILITFLIVRGSIGTFPLSKYIPDISENKFINNLPKNGIYALKGAFKEYKNSKEGEYNLIAEYGYKGKVEEAFELVLKKTDLDKNKLIESLSKETIQNQLLQDNPPHVVVVMVESFGLPIIKHQSKTFNIMGSLNKHFKEDTVFENFISTGNGTISSLEALLLNITSRPKSTPLSQSKYMQTEFKSAAAKVYQEKGYETSFVYGGNLSWRNIGIFYDKQGFDKIDGKAAILKELNLDESKSSHVWGVFDEFSYEFVLNKLKNAKKPQFIFLLTTNNHPPFIIPEWYNSKSLIISPDLKSNLHGDMNIISKRLKDYAYALDQAGEFMHKIKTSYLKNNTVIGITADNNTIEGLMSYSNYYDEAKKIPFYLYMPNYLKRQYNINIPGSHKDIFPTLYNLTLSNATYLSVGTDLYSDEELHCGFNKAGVIMSKDGGFSLKTPKTPSQIECVDYYKASLAITEYILNKNEKE